MTGKIKSDKVQLNSIQNKLKVLPHVAISVVDEFALAQQTQACTYHHLHLQQTCEKSQLTMLRIRSAMAEGCHFLLGIM